MAEEFDMNRMREEAARRAREMQSRAHIPPSQRPGQGPRRQENRAPDQQHPAEQGHRESPHQGQEQAPRENPNHGEPPSPPPPAGVQPVAGAESAPSMLEALFQDKERTIILALLLLLDQDGDHHELMFALMFLLL